MKAVFSTIFALLIFNSYLPAQVITLKKRDGLVGQVRSYRYINPYQTQDALYDRQGNEISHSLYKPDGSIEHEVSTVYNRDGTVSSWKEYYGKDVANAEGLHKHAVFTYRAGKQVEVVVYREDSVCYKSIYVYDNQRRKIREINSGPDAIFTSRDYKYDSAGNLVEESSTGTSYSSRVERVFDSMNHAVVERFFDNGVLSFSIRRTYEKDRLVKEEGVDPAGKLTRVTFNTYNPDGKLIESMIAGRGIISKTVIEYDLSGRITRKESLTTRGSTRGFSSSEDPAPGKIVTRYDERGFNIESLYYSESGVLTVRQISVYDAQAKQIEMISYKPAGGIESKYTYEYDEHGNRVKTILMAFSPKGEVQSSVLEQRIISYY